jgi:hypothetical protein
MNTYKAELRCNKLTTEDEWCGFVAMCGFGTAGILSIINCLLILFAIVKIIFFER